jgi:hypothetical protein
MRRAVRTILALAALSGLLSFPSAPVRAAVLEAGNDIYRVHVIDETEAAVGCYTATTGSRHPSGEGLNVLFGDGVPWSSFTTVRSFDTGTDYVMGDGASDPIAGTVGLDAYGVVTPLGSRGIRTTYTLPGPPVTPDAFVVVSDVAVEGDTFEASRISVTTSVTNRGGGTARVGVRYLWDYQIGLDDGPTFRTISPAGGLIGTEAEFRSPSIDSYRITDNDMNPAPPTFDILGTVRGPAGLSPTPPDLLQYVAWPNASTTSFDYAVDPLQDVASLFPEWDAYSVNDSAVLYFFGRDRANALSIAPGATARVDAALFLTPPADPPPPVARFRIDVRPGSDRNPLNVSERGVLPVALLGSASLPAGQVDPATLRLEGVRPLRWAYEDVASPTRDGFPDLVLHFDARAVSASVASRLGRTPSDGERVVVFLRGSLRGTASTLEGTDTVLFLAKKKGGR